MGLQTVFRLLSFLSEQKSVYDFPMLRACVPFYFQTSWPILTRFGMNVKPLESTRSHNF
jgi:hypothetical protein